MSRAVPRYRRNNVALPAPPNDVFEVAVLGQIELQSTINTFYYRTDGSSLDPLAEELIANKVVLDLVPALINCQAVGYQFLKVRVSCLTKPTRTPGERAAATPLFGAFGGTNLPSTDAVVFVRRTAVRSACGRGRFYLPGVPSSVVTDSQITDAAYITLLGTLVTAYLTPIAVLTVGTITPGLWSKGSRTHKTLGFAELHDGGFNAVIGTVRRRRIGRGK